ncbi:hypothetical protein HG530_009686 [Fusarium avenaceum]|nr:hypothetical protein HG530_009686 [Fusarium avenaceum]
MTKSLTQILRLSTHSFSASILRHHQSDAAEVVLVKLVFAVNTTGNRVDAVVEQVVVKLTITSTKLLLLQEERIVHQCQSVEHIELVALGDDKRIMNQVIETLLESSLVEVVLQSDLRTIVEHRLTSTTIKILLFQRSQTLNGGVVRQRILANLVLRLAVGRERAETALVELLPVDSTVEVSTSADGLGKDDTGSVETLPDSVKVAASCDFLDEYGSETLASELFVNGKEINLGAGDYVFADTGSRKAHSLPSQDGRRIVEAEHSLIVFNVVLVEQLVHLLDLLLVGQVHSNPFKAGNEARRLLVNLLDLLNAKRTLLQGRFFAKLGHRLRLPELVRTHVLGVFTTCSKTSHDVLEGHLLEHVSSLVGGGVLAVGGLGHLLGEGRV